MIDIHEYVVIEMEGDMAIVSIEVKSERMNIISPNLIDVFDQIFTQLIHDKGVKGIVLTSKRKDFIAGADIKSFNANAPGEFMPVLQKGHAILNKIANSPKPIVAAISGTCYGLGVELSLACHVRLISDEAESKMALPEVKLGLLPGAGGTVRLPKLVGITHALDMMLTGKNIFPYQAKKMGLVHDVVPVAKLKAASILWIEKLLKKETIKLPKQSLLNGFLNHTAIGRYIVFAEARKKVYQQTRGHFPAPMAIIDCVKQHVGESETASLSYEAKRFEELLLGKVSKQLIGLFFAMTESKKNPYPDQILPVNKMGIIGGGFMGKGIAEVSLDKMEFVQIADIAPETLQEACKKIWQSLLLRVKKKRNTSIEIEQLINRLHVTENIHDLKKCDLVIEAIIEKMEVKLAVFKQLFSNGNPQQIVATNTSSLSLQTMQASVAYPDRLIGMHYFSPVQKMPLLEIVVTETTGRQAIATAFDVGSKQGKTCVVVKDGPGFYVNRILSPYLNECLLLLEEGIPIETIEKVMVQIGFPVGPFQLMDEVGFDIIVHATEANKEYAATRKGYKPNFLLKTLFEAGYKGRKNNKGFYAYDASGKRNNKFDRNLEGYVSSKSNQSLPVEDILERPLFLMLQEAQLCLQEGIIRNKLDGNIAAIFGIGFMPYTGGPFEMLDDLGTRFSERMFYFAQKYGERFNQL